MNARHSSIWVGLSPENLFCNSLWLVICKFHHQQWRWHLSGVDTRGPSGIHPEKQDNALVGAEIERDSKKKQVVARYSVEMFASGGLASAVPTMNRIGFHRSQLRLRQLLRKLDLIQCLAFCILTRHDISVCVITQKRIVLFPKIQND